MLCVFPIPVLIIQTSIVEKKGCSIAILGQEFATRIYLVGTLVSNPVAITFRRCVDLDIWQPMMPFTTVDALISLGFVWTFYMVGKLLNFGSSLSPGSSNVVTLAVCGVPIVSKVGWIPGFDIFENQVSK